MEKIVIGINVLTDINSWAYRHHMNLFFRLGRDLTEYDFIFSCPYRMGIDRMRNMTAKVALDNDAKYLVFIDDDVLVPSNAVKQMIETSQKYDAPIVCGEVFVRGYPYEPMFFNYYEKTLDGNPHKVLNHYHDYKDKLDKNGVTEIEALGFSCALIDVDLLRNLRPPFFVTGQDCTEDVYFCMKAKHELENVKILLDTKIVCSHIVGEYFVNSQNRESLRRFDEEVFGAKPKEKESDRSERYLEECQVQFAQKA